MDVHRIDLPRGSTAAADVDHRLVADVVDLARSYYANPVEVVESSFVRNNGIYLGRDPDGSLASCFFRPMVADVATRVPRASGLLRRTGSDPRRATKRRSISRDDSGVDRRCRGDASEGCSIARLGNDGASIRLPSRGRDARRSRARDDGTLARRVSTCARYRKGLPHG